MSIVSSILIVPSVAPKRSKQVIGVLIGRERVHACAVGRQQTRTSAVQNRLHAEQNLVRAVRVTADVLVFLVVDPVAVNVLTDLVKRILIGLCQLFALKVVQRIVAGRFCGECRYRCTDSASAARELDAMRLPPAIIVYEVSISAVRHNKAVTYAPSSNSYILLRSNAKFMLHRVLPVVSMARIVLPSTLNNRLAVLEVGHAVIRSPCS